ncbi:hypothetical protein T08_1091 [Trichinella sp. T8]|nr:hypothetical protein T08_1091 [Trichinella sp. T8]
MVKTDIPKTLLKLMLRSKESFPFYISRKFVLISHAFFLWRSMFSRFINSGIVLAAEMNLLTVVSKVELATDPLDYPHVAVDPLQFI